MFKQRVQEYKERKVIDHVKQYRYQYGCVALVGLVIFVAMRRPPQITINNILMEGS